MRIWKGRYRDHEIVAGWNGIQLHVSIDGQLMERETVLGMGRTIIVPLDSGAELVTVTFREALFRNHCSIVVGEHEVAAGYQPWNWWGYALVALAVIVAVTFAVSAVRVVGSGFRDALQPPKQ